MTVNSRRHGLLPVGTGEGGEMAERGSARCGIVRAAAAAGLAGLVAACASGPAPEPAPVILNGASPGVLGQASIAPRSGAEARHIVVRPGQSLGGIAHTYHVPA